MSRMKVRTEFKIPWAAAHEVSPLSESTKQIVSGESMLQCSAVSGGKQKFHTILLVMNAVNPILPSSILVNVK